MSKITPEIYQMLVQLVIKRLRKEKKAQSVSPESLLVGALEKSKQKDESWDHIDLEYFQRHMNQYLIDRAKRRATRGITQDVYEAESTMGEAISNSYNDTVKQSEASNECLEIVGGLLEKLLKSQPLQAEVYARHFEGYSDKDIACDLGLTLNQVDYRKKQAKDWLQAQLIKLDYKELVPEN